MKKKEPNYVGVDKYAELCEVTPPIIRKRIGQKKIVAHKKRGAYLIDLNEFPPIKGGLPAGRPSAEMIAREEK